MFIRAGERIKEMDNEGAGFGHLMPKGRPFHMQMTSQFAQNAPFASFPDNGLGGPENYPQRDGLSLVILSSPSQDIRCLNSSFLERTF